MALIAAASRNRERFIDARVAAMWALYLRLMTGGAVTDADINAHLWADVCYYRAPERMFEVLWGQAKTPEGLAAQHMFYAHLSSYLPQETHNVLIEMLRRQVHANLSEFMSDSQADFVYETDTYHHGFWHMVTLLGALSLGQQRDLYWSDTKVRDAFTRYLSSLPWERLMGDVAAWFSGAFLTEVYAS